MENEIKIPKTTMLAVTSIRLNEMNPRENDEVVPVIAQSIREFGFIQPICIDAAGTVLCGNTRLKAAISLGMKEVPCVSAEHLSPIMIKKLIALENKMHELAKHNYEMLKTEYLDPIVAELGQDDPLLNMVWTKTDMQMIDGLFAGADGIALDPSLGDSFKGKTIFKIKINAEHADSFEVKLSDFCRENDVTYERS